MEFKGTKGDWSICGDGKYRLSIDSRINDGRSVCGPKTLATVNTSSNQEEVLANGLLMSKSKEMLEELVRSKETIEKLKNSLIIHHDCAGGFAFAKSMDIADQALQRIEQLIIAATTI